MMLTKGHGVSVRNIGVLNVIFAWILRDGDIIKADLVPGSTNIQMCVPHVSLFCACSLFNNVLC